MKGILFNQEMVRAILDGRKSVTRRVIKPQPNERLTQGENAPELLAAACAPYCPGDILYVRETWTKLWYVDLEGYTHFDQPMYYYAADGKPDITLYDADGFEEDDQRIRWRSSIHMPKEAARIFLRVTDVRMERLQSITPEQVDAEGCKEWAYSAKTGELLPSSPSWFKISWDSTIKKADLPRYGWNANPYVWRVSFERISKEEAYKDAH